MKHLENDAAFTFYREFLEFYARWFEVDTYLEIGCQSCETIHRFLKQEYPSHMIGIDIEESNNAKYLHANHQDRFIFYKGDSDTFFRDAARADGQWELIFIDGDHSEEQVLKDVGNALDHLAEDGLIVLHDTFPPSEEYATDEYCGTAYRAVISLRQRDDIEVYTFRMTYGLTLVGKKGSKADFRWQK